MDFYDKSDRKLNFSLYVFFWVRTYMDLYIGMRIHYELL